MTLYPEMNEKIVDLLRMGDTPVELYAAQRIEELELKNMVLIDRVLEIIDLRIRGLADRKAEILFAYTSLRNEVKALKG